jgi:hypothetical protein
VLFLEKRFAFVAKMSIPCPLTLGGNANKSIQPFQFLLAYSMGKKFVYDVLFPDEQIKNLEQKGIILDFG